MPNGQQISDAVKRNRRIGNAWHLILYVLLPWQKDQAVEIVFRITPVQLNAWFGFFIIAGRGSACNSNAVVCFLVPRRTSPDILVRAFFYAEI